MNTLRNVEVVTGSIDAYAEGVEFRGVSHINHHIVYFGEAKRYADRAPICLAILKISTSLQLFLCDSRPNVHLKPDPSVLFFYHAPTGIVYNTPKALFHVLFLALAPRIAH